VIHFAVCVSNAAIAATAGAVLTQNTFLTPPDLLSPGTSFNCTSCFSGLDNDQFFTCRTTPDDVPCIRECEATVDFTYGMGVWILGAVWSVVQLIAIITAFAILIGNIFDRFHNLYRNPSVRRFNLGLSALSTLISYTWSILGPEVSVQGLQCVEIVGYTRISTIGGLFLAFLVILGASWYYEFYRIDQRERGEEVSRPCPAKLLRVVATVLFVVALLVLILFALSNFRYAWNIVLISTSSAQLIFALVSFAEYKSLAPEPPEFDAVAQAANGAAVA